LTALNFFKKSLDNLFGDCYALCHFQVLESGTLKSSRKAEEGGGSSAVKKGKEKKKMGNEFFQSGI